MYLFIQLINMDNSRDFSLVFLFSSKIVPMKSKHRPLRSESVEIKFKIWLTLIDIYFSI